MGKLILCIYENTARDNGARYHYHKVYGDEKEKLKLLYFVII